MKRVTTFSEARQVLAGRVGLVATMGYLHEGHLSLMQRAKAVCDTLVASIFVNPLQFAPGEDFENYPRDIERDAALMASVGVDVLFSPSIEEMYPAEPSIRIVTSPLGDRLEGEGRPRHFDGVAMAVVKLFAGLRPDVAVFGRKDAQQLAIVRRLVRDLSFPVEIMGAPITREFDGLALSSRNVRLSDSERTAALALHSGLVAAASLVEAGERDGSVLEKVAATPIEAEPLLELHYAELTDAAELTRLPKLSSDAFLAVSAQAGSVRLIDNFHIIGGLPEIGIRLDHPSIVYQGGQ